MSSYSRVFIVISVLYILTFFSPVFSQNCVPVGEKFNLTFNYNLPQSVVIWLRNGVTFFAAAVESSGSGCLGGGNTVAGFEFYCEDGGATYIMEVTSKLSDKDVNFTTNPTAGSLVYTPITDANPCLKTLLDCNQPGEKVEDKFTFSCESTCTLDHHLILQYQPESGHVQDLENNVNPTMVKCNNYADLYNSTFDYIVDSNHAVLRQFNSKSNKVRLIVKMVTGGRNETVFETSYFYVDSFAQMILSNGEDVYCSVNNNITVEFTVNPPDRRIFWQRNGISLLDVKVNAAGDGCANSFLPDPVGYEFDCKNVNSMAVYILKFKSKTEDIGKDFTLTYINPTPAFSYTAYTVNGATPSHTDCDEKGKFEDELMCKVYCNCVKPSLSWKYTTEDQREGGINIPDIEPVPCGHGGDHFYKLDINVKNSEIMKLLPDNVTGLVTVTGTLTIGDEIIYPSTTLTVNGQSYNLTGSSSYGVKGEEFRFLCKIPDGAGVPFILRFRKDGMETCRVDPDDCKGIPVNNNNQYKCGCINNNNRLYYMNISSLTSSHHGNWICTNFTITAGSSNTISLPVYTLPTITNIQSNTNNNQTTEGSTVVFSCSGDGLPVPNVTWSTSKGRQLSSSKAYTLPEARCEDTDNYTCRASNGVGSPVSTTLPLYVTCSPREKCPPVTKVRSRIDSTVTLEVDIIAFPKPEFTWRFEERNEILTDEVEEISLFNYRSYLKLKLDESMFGNYTVVVGNSVGVPVHFTFTVSEVTDDDPEEETSRKGDDEGGNGLTVEGVSLGVGVGVGVGVILTLTVVAGVFIFLYRSGRIVFTSNKPDRDDSADQRRQDNIPSVYDRVGGNLHDNSTSPTYAGLDEGKRELESDGYQQLNLYNNQHIK